MFAVALTDKQAMARRSGAHSAMTQKPNVILILTDDQGYNDLGCFGSDRIKTPNIDRMAAEGMRFTDFYATSPICTPTRASLVTGCYPSRVGLGTPLHTPDNVASKHPDKVKELKARLKAFEEELSQTTRPVGTLVGAEAD